MALYQGVGSGALGAVSVEAISKGDGNIILGVAGICVAILGVRNANDAINGAIEYAIEARNYDRWAKTAPTSAELTSGQER